MAGNPIRFPGDRLNSSHTTQGVMSGRLPSMPIERILSATTTPRSHRLIKTAPLVTLPRPECFEARTP